MMPQPVEASEYKMSKSEQKKRNEEEMKWRAEEDLRVLLQANAIRKDDARMKAALKIGKEKAKEYKEIQK